MKRLAGLVALVGLAGLLCWGVGSFLPLSQTALAAAPAAKAEGQPAKGEAPAAPARSLADDMAILDLQRQQLLEKEAALKVKEEELKKLAATLDARIAEMNSARKAVDATLTKKQEQDAERYRKVLKVYKGLKPEEAGRLMDKLDEELVIGMLNQMDQRSAAKLIPFLNQQRVVKWTRLNLIGPAAAPVALADGRKPSR